MKTFLNVFCRAVLALSPLLLPPATFAAPSQPATQPSHNQIEAKQAAEALFKALDYAKSYDETIQRLVDSQIQQMPVLAPYKPEMLAFLNKYMSWDSIKDEVIVMYSETFTAQELQELAAFYQTPLGKKALKKMPELVAKGAAMGQQRVQAHEAEFEAMIKKAREAREAQ